MSNIRDDLKAEYQLLQNQYEAFDQRALSLKALATPLLGAGIAVGWKEVSLPLIAMTMVAAGAIWLLEVNWKIFQYCNVPRIKQLEAWFREEAPADIPPFQIFTSWTEAWPAWKDAGKIWSIARQPFVALPYVVIIVAGLIVVGYSPDRFDPPPASAPTPATQSPS